MSIHKLLKYQLEIKEYTRERSKTKSAGPMKSKNTSQTKITTKPTQYFA